MPTVQKPITTKQIRTEYGVIYHYTKNRAGVHIILVWRCLLGLAPAYLVEFCGPIQRARSSRALRSADQGLLRVPFARTSASQKRAFAVVGPSNCNGLALTIRSLPRSLSQTFLPQLKAVLFGRVGVGSASE